MSTSPPNGKSPWTCAAIRAVVYEFLDRELAPEDDAGIRQHLAHCAHCAPCVRGEATFLRFLEERVVMTPAPEALRRRILQALGCPPDPSPPGAEE